MDLPFTPSSLPEFRPLILPKVLMHGHVVPEKPPDKPQRAGAEQRELCRAGGRVREQVNSDYYFSLHSAGGLK